MRSIVPIWEAACDAPVISVAVTPNCSSISAATTGRHLYLFNGDGSHKWESPFEADYEGWATSISSDGQVIALGTANKSPADGTVYVFDRQKRLLWSARIRHPVWSVSLSGDGGRLAIATWGENQLLLYQRQASGYSLVVNRRIPGSSGLYGVKQSHDGSHCVVASYDTGIFVLDKTGDIVSQIPYDGGLYNVCLTHSPPRVLAGTRSGTFIVGAIEGSTPRESAAISQRPLCGIATVADGSIVAAGSFDGRLLITNGDGDILWEHQSNGEIWSTAISDSGRFVCIGSGDHSVRMFESAVDVSSIREVTALESALNESSGATTSVLIDDVIQQYLRLSLISYGSEKLSCFLANRKDAHVFKDRLKFFLESALRDAKDNPTTHWKLAELLVGEQQFFDAARHFQMAARSPSLRSSAQRRAAECFAELRFNTASTSAWRQSREQHLDHDARHVLFTLARSYEDLGHLREAAKIYELIVSWDTDYRNAWTELQQIVRTIQVGNATDCLALRQFGDIATGFLGSDSMRGVDPSLVGVVASRSKEVLIEACERIRVHETVEALLADSQFSRGIRRDIAQLDYDTQLFLRYDFGLPEDEMKKFLETVNAIPYIMQKTRSCNAPLSLDIGSATGRYPSLLTRLGFRATGIDIEPEAINYAKKYAKEGDRPRYICGDARQLDTYLPASETFDVVTCMMGTFQHISPTDQPDLINSIARILQPGGVAIMSLWDIECGHLAYLSMYDETQKDKIRQNSRTWAEMTDMFLQAGFHRVEIVPACLLPQNVIYDLGIERLRADDISIAAQADLAVRALYRQRHGELFLTVGFKHD